MGIITIDLGVKMNCNVFTSSFVLALSVLVLPAKSGVVDGGFHRALEDPVVVSFAIEELKAANGGLRESCNMIVKNIEEQVVDGTNYKFDLVMAEFPFCPTFPEVCHMMVYESLEGTLIMEDDETYCKRVNLLL